MTNLIAIAAVARNGTIGAAGDLPWRAPDDLRRFKQRTAGHVLIAGAKTAMTLPRMPDRHVVIVTSQARAFAPQHYSTVASPMAALTTARRINATNDAYAKPDIFVIGGAQIFAGLAFAIDVLDIAYIDDDVPGDVTFPRDLASQFNWESFAAPPPVPAVGQFDAATGEGSRTKTVRGSFHILTRKIL